MIWLFADFSWIAVAEDLHKIYLVLHLDRWTKGCRVAIRLKWQLDISYLPQFRLVLFILELVFYLFICCWNYQLMIYCFCCLVVFCIFRIHFVNFVATVPEVRVLFWRHSAKFVIEAIPLCIFIGLVQVMKLELRALDFRLVYHHQTKHFSDLDCTFRTLSSNHCCHHQQFWLSFYFVFLNPILANLNLLPLNWLLISTFAFVNLQFQILGNLFIYLLFAFILNDLNCMDL